MLWGKLVIKTDDEGNVVSNKFGWEVFRLFDRCK